MSTHSSPWTVACSPGSAIPDPLRALQPDGRDSPNAEVFLRPQQKRTAPTCFESALSPPGPASLPRGRVRLPVRLGCSCRLIELFAGLGPAPGSTWTRIFRATTTVAASPHSQRAHTQGTVLAHTRGPEYASSGPADRETDATRELLALTSCWSEGGALDPGLSAANPAEQVALARRRWHVPMDAARPSRGAVWAVTAGRYRGRTPTTTDHGQG